MRGPEKRRHYRRFVGSDSHENLRYIQEFYCYQPQCDQPDVMSPTGRKKAIIAQKRDKK